MQIYCHHILNIVISSCSEPFYPDRTMNQPPWPNPGYREGEMNPLQPPNMPWDMKTSTTLEPPPGIPKSLNWPTQSSNFNMGGPRMAGVAPRPAFWEPLPPPPMFPGQGIESKNPVPILPGNFFFLVEIVVNNSLVFKIKLCWFKHADNGSNVLRGFALIQYKSIL